MAEKKENQKLQALEEATANFREKLLDLLYNGEYKINRINRSIIDNRVNWVDIELGENNIFLNEPQGFGENGYVEVRMSVKELPINKALLEEYDRMSIDRDIAYYQRRLDELQEHKKKLIEGN